MDKYLEQSVIGRGQFGTVSLAIRVSDFKSVVIKKIPLDSSDAKERDSALNEARLLKSLDHPNIINYFESFIGDRDTLMIVMEYARGGTLSNFLAQQVGHFVDEEVVLHLFSQMALAIAYIHAQNILHRDLKPQNILLDETFRIVKIGDFGISTVLTTKTKATTVVGTPNYLGPEVCEGRPYDQKSDIWSLGCVLFETTALHRAFDGSNLGAIINLIQKAKLKQPIPSHYSGHLKRLISWLLEKNPHYRPSAAQLIAYPPIMLATSKVVCSVGRISTMPNQPGKSQEATPNRLRGQQSVDDVTLSAKPRLQQRCFLFTADSGAVRLPMMTPPQLISRIAVGRDLLAGVFSGSGKPFTWEESYSANENGAFSLRSLHLDVNLVVTEIACGDNFVAALSERGLVLTTGSGCYGCLGHGSFLDITGTWRIVDGLLGSRIVAIGCGARHVLAGDDDGQLFGWGESNSGRLGRLLDGDQAGSDGTTMVTSPKRVKLPEQFSKTESRLTISNIFCGNDCSCVLLKTPEDPSTSHIICSGINRANRLFLSKNKSVVFEFAEPSLPIKEIKNDQIVKISFGMKHAVLLLDNGAVYGWGENARNQLATTPGSESKKFTDNSVKKLLDQSADDISCGDFFTAVLTADGEVKLFGSKDIVENFHQWSNQKPNVVDDDWHGTIKYIYAKEAKLAIVECSEN